MQTIGFLISHKNNEKRRAILPKDLLNIANPENMYFETGYGKCLGIEDEEYSTMVIIPTIVNSKEKVIELFKKIEVYYLANKEENLYFTLLRRLHIIKKWIRTFW